MKDELINIDRAFSAMSVEKGAQSAFSYYSTTDVISYQQQSAPIIGHDKLVESFGEFPVNAKLEWAPFFSDVSASGDFGYTLGHYKMAVPQTDGSTKVSEGNYVTIWKKQENGEWKFVFDTGSIGPAPSEF